MYLKRVITKNSPLKTCKEAKHGKENLGQSKIQAWIKHIIIFLEQVRNLEGRNEYGEGLY